MSVPQKPWENPQLNTRQHSNLGPVQPDRRNVLYSHGPQPVSQTTMHTAPLSGPQRVVQSLPPLPQRPPQLYNQANNGGFMGGHYNRFGSYGGMGMGGMGYDPYRGGYSAYGGFGYGSYPGGGAFENRFLQVAREGSRDAFESIESIVRAFSSVSMMLESTYYAMNSSFNAVLGVVDNFSRLRQMFIQFVSTMTILRIIRNFYRRLLYWLGVMDRSPPVDRVWDSVGGPSGGEGTVAAPVTAPKWPLITFLAFLFGGPYLISKIFGQNQIGSQWDRSKGHRVVACYAFRAGTEAELSFRAGEVLNMAPREMQLYHSSGWLLVMNEEGRTGYAPFTRLFTSNKAAPAPTAASQPADEVYQPQAPESQ